MNAGRPMELGARFWAVAAALFFFAVGAALGQQAATTPTQAEKELEIKKKEVKQTELDLQKKRAELEKLKVALKYQETAQAININLQADVLFDLGKAEIRPEAEAALDKVGAVIQEFPNSKVRDRWLHRLYRQPEEESRTFKRARDGRETMVGEEET